MQKQTATVIFFNRITIMRIAGPVREFLTINKIIETVLTRSVREIK